jgi:hypothetical protein
MDKPEWQDLKDLRGDMWCHCILAVLSLTIAATALIWLTYQQNEIQHLQHATAILNHSLRPGANRCIQIRRR